MSEQANVAAEGSANAGVRPEQGGAPETGTTISVDQANSGEHAATNPGATPPAQTGAVDGAAGAAPSPAATGAAGQDQPPQANKTPLRGPLAVAPSPQPPSAGATGEAAASWPENWREAAAGGDADVAKRLERYADPAALAKALVETQNTLRNKGKIEAPGENATDAEKA